jgi:hypothetical protein
MRAGLPVGCTTERQLAGRTLVDSLVDCTTERQQEGRTPGDSPEDCKPVGWQADCTMAGWREGCTTERRQVAGMRVDSLEDRMLHCCRTSAAPGARYIARMKRSKPATMPLLPAFWLANYLSQLLATDVLLACYGPQ